MTQDELDALTQQHGGIAGQTQIGPTTEPNPDFADAPSPDDFKRPIPKERRTQHIVFKDGYRIELQPDTNSDGSASGTFQVVTPLTEGPKNTGTGSSSSSVRTVRGANGQDQIEVKDPSDPSGLTWVVVGGTVSNPDEDQVKAIQRQILEGQRNEREANQAKGKGYLTNDQVATVERDAQANNTSAADVQVRKDQLAQTAQDAERTAGLRQQEINNQSADLGLRAKAQQAQVDAQNAANDLAKKRLELDQAVQNHTMSADDAKFEYQKQWNDTQAKAQNARLLLDQSTEADRKAESAATNATTQRGQDMTAQNETLNRQATAANTALTQAEAGGKTGADILNQRATNARDTLNQTLAPVENSKNFGLGGGLPAGFGSTLLQGVNDWTAQLAGGQDVLKTAQDLVHNANPTLAGTPAGAAWSAVLGQMLGTKQSQDAAAGATFTPPTGTNAPAAPAAPSVTAPGAPSDVLAGQTAPQDYQPGGGFAQSGMPEGSDRNHVLVTPDGHVHIFIPPTGSPPDANGDSTQLGGIA